MWEPRRNNQLYTDAPGIRDWISQTYQQASDAGETTSPTWDAFGGQSWENSGDPQWAQKRAAEEQNGDWMGWQQRMMQASGSRPGGYTGDPVELFRQFRGDSAATAANQGPRFDLGYDPTAGFGSGPRGGLGGLGGMPQAQQPSMASDSYGDGAAAPMAPQTAGGWQAPERPNTGGLGGLGGFDFGPTLSAPLEGNAASAFAPGGWQAPQRQTMTNTYAPGMGQAGANSMPKNPWG